MSGPRILPFTLVVATLAAILLFGANAGVTMARLVACRSDPVVILSDGTIVDVSAEIDTLLWNVTEVHYTLHVPSGLSPVVIIHTPAWLTSQETFTFYSDSSPDEFTSTTTVRTRRADTEVTAHMLVNLRHGSASGMTGQALTVFLNNN